MTRLADQAYLRTRLAILGENLLGEQRLMELTELSLDELAEATGFEDVKGARNLERLEAYERALMQSWLDELSALLRPLSGASRKLLIQWASRYELLNIKALVRGKIGQLPADEIERNLFKLPGFLSLNHEALLNTDSIPELLRQLQKTRYRRIATQALRRYEEHPDPFLLDATLDQQFYSDLSARAQQLDSTDRKEILDLIGRVVDRHNLVWSLRYRFNYGLQASEVLYLAIDGGRFINRATLHDIIQSESVAEAVQRVPDSLRRHGDMPDRISVIDAMLRQDVFHYARTAMRLSPSVLASVLAYLVLRFGEISQITAILHARVYGIPDDVLKEVLQPLGEEAA